MLHIVQNKPLPLHSDRDVRSPPTHRAAPHEIEAEKRHIDIDRMKQQLKIVGRIHLLYKRICIKAAVEIGLDDKVFPHSEPLHIVHFFVAKSTISAFDLMPTHIIQRTSKL